MDIEGVIPPTLTPVTGRTGDVDADALEAYIRTLVDAGVHGLFPCGSNGEFPSLTREQRRTVVETVVEASGSVPVLAGCGGTNPSAVDGLIDDAAAAGADAAVVVTPYYLQTTQSGLCAFFETVADDAALPVFLYNIPHLTGQHLDPETIGALADHEGVVGVKDSTGNLDHFDRVHAAVPDDFVVLQGMTTYSIPSLDLGADGMVSGFANLLPGVVAGAYDAYDAGNRDRAVELMTGTIAPLARELSSMPLAPAMKYLVSKASADVGPPLVPLPELSEEDRRRLDRCYEERVEPVLRSE